MMSENNPIMKNQVFGYYNQDIDGHITRGEVEIAKDGLLRQEDLSSSEHHFDH